MGTGADAAILSIGAVSFDINTGEIGSTFHVKVSLESCVRAGLKMDVSTVLWWLKQNDDARRAVSDGVGMELKEALEQLERFIKPGVNVWANSPRFDLGILQTAYRLFDKNIPWDFRKERDVRTLVSYDTETAKSIAFDGTLHNPVHDCIHQIRVCVAIHGPLKLTLLTKWIPVFSWPGGQRFYSCPPGKIVWRSCARSAL